MYTVDIFGGRGDNTSYESCGDIVDIFGDHTFISRGSINRGTLNPTGTLAGDPASVSITILTLYRLIYMEVVVT